MNLTRDMVVAEARKMLGTKFHHQGRLPGVGLDCVGVVVSLAKALGIVVEDVANYSKVTSTRHGQRLTQALENSFYKIPLDDMEPGDIVQFWIDKRGLGTHVGIAMPEQRVLHSLADPSINRVVEQRMGKFWYRRIVQVYRIPGVQ